MDRELWLVTGADNVVEEDKVFCSRELALEYARSASVGFDVVIHTDYDLSDRETFKFIRRKFFSYPGGFIVWGAPIS